jgi:V/A-type H+-transporting ATPase subunit A
MRVLRAPLAQRRKDDARTFFAQLRQRFLDLNGAEWESDDFRRLEQEIDAMVASRGVAAPAPAAAPALAAAPAPAAEAAAGR